jgi:hypothetical protein
MCLQATTGVAGDPIQSKILKLMIKMNKNVEAMNKKLETVEQNSKPTSRLYEVCKTVAEIVALVLITKIWN